MSAKQKKPQHPFVAQAERYVDDVLTGRKPVCEWIKLACQRHRDDIERSKTSEFQFRFDAEKADRACEYISLLKHTKGEWRGQLIVLQDWQCWIICSIFGWIDKLTALRRFRRALIFIPRKNAKSTLAAAIGMYMLTADGEPGAEVYSGATSERQAWEVFGTARQMAKMSVELRRTFGLMVNASNLAIEATASKFEPIIGQPGDGASPSCSIHDEYHEHKTDGQVDTMLTGMGARRQPLQLLITTAGANLAGPCYAAMRDGQQLLQGAVTNDRLFVAIYTIDLPRQGFEGDDWQSIDALKKANPNFGISVSEEFLQQQLLEAINTPRKRGTFKTKHLNVWVQAMAGYFDVPRWIALGDEALRLEDFFGLEAYFGLDLASKVDIAALEILIRKDGKIYRFGKYYIPRARLEDPENEHYRSWHEQGWLTVTDGEIIDYDEIKEDILDLCKKFTVRQVAYDPHQATMLVTQLMKDGVPVLEYRPTVLNFSEPMKTMDADIKSDAYRHNGDPVMTWMISNVVAREDKKQNVYPNKDSDEKKIDGVIAHLSAKGCLMQDMAKELGSVPVTADQVFRVI